MCRSEKKEKGKRGREVRVCARRSKKVKEEGNRKMKKKKGKGGRLKGRREEAMEKRKEERKKVPRGDILELSPKV